MASPQKENGYTPIANEILENIYKLPLNGTQLKILLVIWRFSYGFSRKEASLSLNFISNAISCSKTHVKREIDKLITSKILITKQPASFTSSRTISFNKDYTVYELGDSTIKSIQSTEQNPAQYTDCSTAQYTDCSTKKANYKTNNKEKSNLDDFLETLWKLYPRKRGKAQVSKTQKEKLYKIGLDELSRAVNRYKNEIAGKNEQYVMYGSTFFNSGYVDYLDANYENGQNAESKSMDNTEISDPGFLEYYKSVSGGDHK